MTVGQETYATSEDTGQHVNRDRQEICRRGGEAYKKFLSSLASLKVKDVQHTQLVDDAW